MLGIVTGAFVGAGLALLFAPRSGQETRQQLGEQYRGLADRVGEQAQNWRGTANQLREQANELREQGRERLQQFTSQLSDRASSDRQGANQPSETAFPSSAPSV